ncbi:MAG: hypothetical protein Q9M24_07410 [Mariprofundaceae bacterium]|nr:hypothetical protein [Mariprofundaceae bacterium]
MTASQETGLMQDMHVMSTVLGLGGRLVAGCDGLLPDTQPFIFRLPFSLVIHTAINLLRDGREGEKLAHQNYLYTSGIVGSGKYCIGPGGFGSN